MKRLRVSMEIISGVYEIENILNGHKYVGSSKDIYERWVQHKRALKNKTHHNEYLQNAWNLYGEDNFIFSILETTQNTKKARFEREQYWYDLYEEKNLVLYNISPIVICPSRATTFDDIKNNKRKTSYEQFITICDLLQNTDMPFGEIAKATDMSVSHVYNIYSKYYFEDLTRDMVFIKRHGVIGTPITAKLSEDDVKNIIQEMLDGAYDIDLSKKYGISTSAIQDIRCHRTWRELSDGIELPRIKKLGSYKKGVLQYDLLGNFIAEYVSAREAEEKTGISHKLISKTCRGDKPRTHGYVFKFKN